MITQSNSLLTHHKETLTKESMISEVVIRQRGYFSITSEVECRDLGFSLTQARHISEEYPALIIPQYNTDGRLITYSMRRDNPRVIDQKKKKKFSDGTYPQKILKYEMIKGSGNVLDCHPAIIEKLADPHTPIAFTEGAKKSDSLISKGYCAIGLNGVFGWRGTNRARGKTALAAFEDIALNGRECRLIFDSDIRTNDNVKSALRRFKYYLESKGAKVVPVLLPALGNGKVGVDDYFAAGNTATDLDQLITYFSTFAADLGGEGRKKWTTERFIDLFREWNYHFALNDMNEALYINGQLFDDTRSNILETRLRDDGIPVRHAEVAAVAIGNENRFHPVRDYLLDLEWDGADHIILLASYFKDEHGVFSLYLRKWLIGSVARVLNPGSQNFMLVLDGGQDLGKSEFAQWICPIDDCFSEAPLSPDNKDSRLSLASSWIWEASELGSITRRQDREALKHFITTKSIYERIPYGKRPIKKPAIASFIGSVNNDGSGFLNDPTGSRRFATTTLTHIDWSYSIEVDVNDVWAQAVSLYQSGETYRLVGDDKRRQNEINEQYEIEDPIKSKFLSTFEIVKGDDSASEQYRYGITEMLDLMGFSSSRKDLASRLRAILSSEGLYYERKRVTITRDGRKVRNYFWWGIRLHFR